MNLNDKHIAILQRILSAHLPPNCEVLVFGSHAKGNATTRSDVDLVVKGAPDDRHLYGNLLSALEESDLPFICEIQPYETIRHAALLDHIDRVGVPLALPNSAKNLSELSFN